MKHKRQMKLFLRHPYAFELSAYKIILWIRFFGKQSFRFRINSIKRKINRIIAENAITNIGFNINKTETIYFKNNLIEKADRIVNGYLDIFCIGEKKIDKINWHLDYRSGFRWEPGKFYCDYKIVDITNNAEVKIPWEVSRSHHFLTLGQAYLITGNEKYTEKYIEHALDWINENPFMKSINWVITMEVAIRAVNWIFAFKMFSASPLMDQHIKKSILTSLYQHGYFIFRNPEIRNFNNHNHYLSDLAGQVYLGMFFKGFPEVDIWFKEGIRELYREIRTQILPTGPTYERSINYHRLVTELVAYTVIELDNNNFEIPLDIKYRVEKMFDFIKYYTRPDGQAPVIGDQDDGRFLPFGLNHNTDHRYLLTVAAIYFNRPDLKSLSTGFNPDALFILGKNADEKFNSMKSVDIQLRSKGFKDAGFFIMRATDYYMFINHSGMSRYPEIPAGTHTHSDLLSFELYMCDKSFIVDPGTYLYSSSPKDRKKFRSTKMHNTVVVDGYDQNNLDEKQLWGFERNAIPIIHQWEVTDEYDIFEGSHNGYSRLNDPVTHIRRIFFDKNKKKIEIIDTLKGNDEHLFEWYFHFNQGIELKKINESKVITLSQGSNLELNFHAVKNPTIEFYTDYISKAYGNRQRARVLKLSVFAKAPYSLYINIKDIK